MELNKCTHTVKFSMDQGVVQKCRSQTSKLGCLTENSVSDALDTKATNAGSTTAADFTAAATQEVQCVWNECFNSATSTNGGQC